jgi:hypothetical protein
VCVCVGGGGGCLTVDTTDMHATGMLKNSCSDARTRPRNSRQYDLNHGVDSATASARNKESV